MTIAIGVGVGVHLAGGPPLVAPAPATRVTSTGALRVTSTAVGRVTSPI